MNSSELRKELQKLLKELALPMVREVFDEVILQAEKDNTSYEELLLELFRAEVVDRSE